MHYNTYRTVMELEKRSFRDYLGMDNEVLLETMIRAAMPASDQNKIAMIVAAEAIWVRESNRLTYYLSRDITEFLLHVNGSEDEIDLKGMPEKSFKVYSVSPHPSFKLPPVLVELSPARFVCHTQVVERRGTITTAMTDGATFTWTDKVTESDISSQCARLAYGVHIMERAFPELIKDGFPSDMKERSIRHAQKPKAIRIDLPEQLRDRSGRLKPGTHIRHWHFRHLRHERYARNPDGSIKVILISDMIVNRNSAKGIE